MKPFKVLCIGGSDTSGGAGIQADLKAVSACGCWGLSIITAVTAQNTKGVSDIYPVPPPFVRRQTDVLLMDIRPDAVKTGMLYTAENVQALTRIIKKYKLKKVVVDPVMMAKGGKTLMQNKALKALTKDLLPVALVVTPNIPEAEVLSKIKIRSIPDMKEAAAIIYDLGVKNVLIKGGHLPPKNKSDVTDILYNGSYYEFSSKRINVRDSHGTGCTYASAIASGIAKGESIVEASLKAKIMVTAAIKNGLTLGKGYDSVNVFGEIILNKK